MSPPQHRSFRVPVYASLALAFASIGDAFLYPFLPVNNTSVGVPMVWIGFLLSVNRFVRIFSNTWMVYLFKKYGLRLVTLIATFLAIISTAGYGLAHNVFLWMIFRVMWGLSFSAMRISTVGYALQHARKGFALGLTRGIQEAGTVMALLLALLILHNFNHTITFLLLAGISLPSLYFSWSLPKADNNTFTVIRKSFWHFPSVLNSITFMLAVLIDGIIVVALGILFLHRKENLTMLLATSLAALYLGYRRVCLVIFSPAGGWIADRFGLVNTFNLSLAAIIIGLVLLSFGSIEPGLIVIFTSYSIHIAITPGNVSDQQNDPLSAVSENATWRDIGAAVGTLAGGALLGSDYLPTILIFATFSLALLLLIHLGTARKVLKLLCIWK